jgi:hypothetical protein
MKKMEQDTDRYGKAKQVEAEVFLPNRCGMNVRQAQLRSVEGFPIPLAGAAEETEVYDPRPWTVLESLTLGR